MATSQQVYQGLPDQQSANLQSVNLTPEMPGQAQSGCENCEPADKCCACFPIKCGLLMVTVGSWLSFLTYF